MKKMKVYAMMAATALVLSSCGTSTLTTLGTQVLTDVLTGQTSTGTTTTTTTANTGTTVGNILNSVLGGNNTITKTTLVGTWTYSQPGCAFTSDKLLAQAGGEIVASELKSKLQPTFQKIGVKSSNTTVTFKDDGTFTAKIAGKNWSGNYTFEESTGKIQMSGLLLNINCYAKKNTDGIALLFEASKLLTIMQTLSGKSSALNTIGDIAKSYDGVRIGFDMK